MHAGVIHRPIDCVLRVEQILAFEHAVWNLAAQRCLYSGGESCPRTRSRGLRDDDDVDVILVCATHAGRLPKLRRGDDLELLRRRLHEEFRGPD